MCVEREYLVDFFLFSFGLLRSYKSKLPLIYECVADHLLATAAKMEKMAAKFCGYPFLDKFMMCLLDLNTMPPVRVDVVWK